MNAVVIHSIISEEEETELLEKARIKGVKNKKDAVRLAVQHFIKCDISEPDSLYRKLKKKIENK